MVIPLFIGVVTALVVFGILTKACAGPRKAEKWEKGEIIKQLLALSDAENSSAATSFPTARSSFGSASGTPNHTLRKARLPERNSTQR